MIEAPDDDGNGGELGGASGGAPEGARAPGASEARPRRPLPSYVKSFVQQLSDLAVWVERNYGIPWQVSLAQAALESGWGRHVVRDGVTGRCSNNLFNIKGEGPGGFVQRYVTEYVCGRAVKVVSRFRAYNSIQESFEDYARLLSGDPRYRRLIDEKASVLEFAYALQSFGYATDPRYAHKLITVMGMIARVQEESQEESVC